MENRGPSMHWWSIMQLTILPEPARWVSSRTVFMHAVSTSTRIYSLKTCLHSALSTLQSISRCADCDISAESITFNQDTKVDFAMAGLTGTCVLLQAAGVPTVPGSDGLIKNQQEALDVARKVIDGACPCKNLCKCSTQIASCMQRAPLGWAGDKCKRCPGPNILLNILLAKPCTQNLGESGSSTDHVCMMLIFW